MVKLHVPNTLESETCYFDEVLSCGTSGWRWLGVFVQLRRREAPSDCTSPDHDPFVTYKWFLKRVLIRVTIRGVSGVSYLGA